MIALICITDVNGPFGELRPRLMESTLRLPQYTGYLRSRATFPISTEWESGTNSILRSDGSV